MSVLDELHMRAALELAQKGYGKTSPNPMVGALLVKNNVVIGRGWHRKAGAAHAEIEAIRDARRQDHMLKGATLYVTLEPCCTVGRTPPCTEAIIESGIKKVVVGAVDPNPKHSGRAFRILKKHGIEVRKGVLADQVNELNAAFYHWVKSGTPYITLKSAMTLDGKIATSSGESKWITGQLARRKSLKLRAGSDAILVGVSTILEDDPSLLARGKRGGVSLRRIILDTNARTPLNSQVVSDGFGHDTLIVVSREAPARKVSALRKKVRIIQASEKQGKIDIVWLMNLLGKENVLSVLVEGGGEVSASFLGEGLVNEIAFFYAPKILGGDDSRPAVAGLGVERNGLFRNLKKVKWSKIGPDLLLTASVCEA
jgi:diaminohydroxyphosphoribosylaminopyrimidine deaminase/5-amino-6-(5-phosphoribosylamino)uracil reductase